MNQKQLINQEQLMNQEQLANFIKTIRRDYSLSQTSLARILMVDSSLISHYENMRKTPSWDNIFKLCGHFGYELKIVQKEKDSKRDTSFYYPKSYNALCHMWHDERLDYIFITQEDDVLMNICDINDEKIFNLIPLPTIKDILSKKIFDTNTLALYFKLNRMYPKVEEEMSDFVLHAKHWLKNREDIIDIDKIKFIETCIGYEPAGGGFDEGYFYFYDYCFLDENKKEIDLNGMKIEEVIDYPASNSKFSESIDYELGFNIGKYLYKEIDEEDETIIIPLYY